MGLAPHGMVVDLRSGEPSRAEPRRPAPRRTGMRIVCLLALLVLAACGEDRGDTRGSGAALELEGRTLVVTQATGHELVEGSAVSLAFEDGELRIHAGCNHLSGSYELSGDTLSVGGLGGTEMGCPEPLMEQDAWLARVFSAPVMVARDPLRIVADDAVLELADRADVVPDAPVTRTRWVLDSLVRGDTVGSVPEGVEAHLRIADDGRVELFGGCNGAGGRVTVTDDTLVWGSLIGTLIACEDARGEVERFVRDVLRGRTTYDVTGDRLTISKGDRGLQFRAAD